MAVIVNIKRQLAQKRVINFPKSSVSIVPTQCIFYRKEVLHHKTFHRYTVRAKRGTAQGLKDSQNRSHAPKSAGAALRRHNEAALVKARLMFDSSVPFKVIAMRLSIIFVEEG